VKDIIDAYERFNNGPGVAKRPDATEMGKGNDSSR
jgi:hypothetical protein